MGKPFKLSKPEDMELTLLLTTFLEQHPDYMPLVTLGGTLVLIPWTDSDIDDEFCVDASAESIITANELPI